MFITTIVKFYIILCKYVLLQVRLLLHFIEPNLSYTFDQDLLFHKEGMKSFCFARLEKLHDSLSK